MPKNTMGTKLPRKLEQKMAIVGDGDSIMVFKAAGVATFPAENEKKARDTLR